MTDQSKLLIRDVLRSLSDYGRVSFSQSDPRWQQSRDAYVEFCIAIGDEPQPLMIGSPLRLKH